MGEPDLFTRSARSESPNGDLCSDAKTTILEFIADIKECIFTEPHEQGDLLLVQFFFEKLHPTMIMKHVVDHVLTYEKQIKSRKKQFFVDKKHEIFKGLPKERINYFGDLICKDPAEGGMSAENVDVIWRYFETLLQTGMAFRKLK